MKLVRRVLPRGRRDDLLHPPKRGPGHPPAGPPAADHLCRKPRRRREPDHDSLLPDPRRHSGRRPQAAGDHPLPFAPVCGPGGSQRPLRRPAPGAGGQGEIIGSAWQIR